MSYERINKSIRNIKEKSEENTKYKNNVIAFTRNRKMNFTDFIWYLTYQKGRTTSMELDEYLKNKNGTYEISISKQGFSKQRKNLKPEIFIDLYKDYLEDFYTNYPKEIKKYKDYYILAIDGSMFEVPNTEDLRKEYKTQRNSSGHRETARARVSGIYDVENEFILDAVITDIRKSEQSLAKSHILKVGKLINLKQCLIIFDRGYPSIDLIATLEKLNVKYIFRLQSKMYEEEKRKMNTNDEWINIKITSDRLRKIEEETLKEELKVKKYIKARMLKIVLETGENEFLLTNIPNQIISEKEIKTTYFKRWQIEIGYDILKNKLHIENFTGRTKITIEQDFYAQIYTFNVLQDIKHTANIEIQQKNSNKNLKYEYKPNINILAGWLKNILIAVIFAKSDEERKLLYNIIIEKAEKNLVAIRPNRKYKRKFDTSKRNKYTTNLRNNM